MPLHKDLSNSELHEPKGMQVLTGGAPDIGKVVVSKGDGKTETRRLISSDLNIASFGSMKIVKNLTIGTVLSAAVDSTLYTETDYTQITNLYVADDLFGVGFFNNELILSTSGTYFLGGWMSIKSSAINVNAAFSLTIDGAVPDLSTRPSPRHTVGTGDDEILVSVGGTSALTAGQQIGIAIAVDGATTLTISNSTIHLHLLR